MQNNTLCISTCSGSSDWLDRSSEAFDVIGGEARHIDWRIIRVKLAWSSSIIQRKDLGWDSLRSEVWCTFHSLSVGERGECVWEWDGGVWGGDGGHVGLNMRHLLNQSYPKLQWANAAPSTTTIKTKKTSETIIDRLNVTVYHVHACVRICAHASTSCTYFLHRRLFATFPKQNV